MSYSAAKGECAAFQACDVDSLRPSLFSSYQTYERIWHEQQNTDEAVQSACKWRCERGCAARTEVRHPSHLSKRSKFMFSTTIPESHYLLLFGRE